MNYYTIVIIIFFIIQQSMPLMGMEENEHPDVSPVSEQNRDFVGRLGQAIEDQNTPEIINIRRELAIDESSGDLFLETLLNLCQEKIDDVLIIIASCEGDAYSLNKETTILHILNTYGISEEAKQTAFNILMRSGDYFNAKTVLSFAEFTGFEKLWEHLVITSVRSALMKDISTHAWEGLESLIKQALYFAKDNARIGESIRQCVEEVLRQSEQNRNRKSYNAMLNTILSYISSYSRPDHVTEAMRRWVSLLPADIRRLSYPELFKP